MGRRKKHDEWFNPMAGYGPEQLRAYIIHLENLEAEMAELNSLKAKAYSQAVACGFEKHPLRRVLASRRDFPTVPVGAGEMFKMYEAILAAGD